MSNELKSYFKKLVPDINKKAANQRQMLGHTAYIMDSFPKTNMSIT